MSNYLSQPIKYAAPPTDDKITFEGAGVAVYAPFGKGKMVYDKIMKALHQVR